jgi:hypothetical protein
MGMFDCAARRALRASAADPADPQVPDSIGGNRGAGDGDRTRDVQLGKGADAGEPGKPEDENP